MTAAHARLAPSSAYQWLNCPASVVMQEKFPTSPDSEASREGTAAHEVAGALAQGLPVPATATNGVPVTQEMIDGGQLFAHIAKTRGLSSFEQRVDIPMIHPTECWGTYDAAGFEHGCMVNLIDYKFGYRYVDSSENPQLVLYLMGYLHSLGGDWRKFDADLIIVQPRYYGSEGQYRYSNITGERLMELVPKYQAAAISALAPNPPCKTGPWCRDCSALLFCDAARKTAGEVMEWAGTASSGPQTAESVGAELTYVSRALEILQYRKDALIEMGSLMPRVIGWTKQPKRGRLAWNAPDAEIIATFNLLGVDVAAPQKALTPTQAQKLIDGSVISAYSSRPNVGIEFKPEPKADLILGAKPK